MTDPRTRVLVALMLSMALVAMDTTIVATAIPQVVGDLGGFSLVGWVFSIYLLAQTVTIPVYGKFADLYGRKPVLIIGVVVFLAGSALSAFSWNMVSLILFRALQGLGAGSIGATVNTVAGDLYSVQERGRIQGWLTSVWAVSSVIAPAVGGAFAQYVSWRWIFLVNLPIGAAALALLIRNLHERVERRSQRVDYVGATLLLAASSLLIFGLLQGGTAWNWTSLPSLVVFLLSGLAVAGTVLVERRAAEPIMPLRLWTQRLTGYSYLATGVTGLLIIGLSTFLPIWGQAVLGLDAVAAGFVLAVMTISWPLASALSHRLYLRIGFRDTALVGAILTILAGAFFAALPESTKWWEPVVACAVMGAGLGLITTPLIVGLQSTVGWSQRGVVTGGVMFSRFLGQSLGAAVFGAITNSVLLHRLTNAPDNLRGNIPTTVDGISRALQGDHSSADVTAYLRLSVHASTHAVFVGLFVAAIVTTALLSAIPWRFSAASATVGSTASSSSTASGDPGDGFEVSPPGIR